MTGRNSVGRLLFLGYGPGQTRLIDAVREARWDVVNESGPVSDLSSYDVVVSFGYRTILQKNTLETSRRPVLNLHIAYLPYNRGAHPNFWSFFDSTPTGVTIHEIDEGIDTGPIVFQKKVVFSPNEDTFAKTHRRLIMEIEDLFIQNMGALLSGNYQARPQVGPGTYHATKDLPKSLDDWNSKIQDTIMRLKEGIE